MSERFDLRDGETRLNEPHPVDAQIGFIGHIESPWSFADCPKNIGAARARGATAIIHIRPALRPALDGLEPGMTIVLLYWMQEAPRDLLRQVPRHKPEGAGTFALRSPARPNPVGMGVVRILALDIAQGRVEIDAIDAVNGTPLVDIKPHLPSVDMPE